MRRINMVLGGVVASVFAASSVVLGVVTYMVAEQSVFGALLTVSMGLFCSFGTWGSGKNSGNRLGVLPVEQTPFSINAY